MKKNIYILSEYFAPFQNIGSLKFTKIAKFLSQKSEYNVFIFTRKNYSFNDVFLEQDLKVIKSNGGQVFYINEGLRYVVRNNRIKTTIKYLLMKIIGNERYYYESNQKTSKHFVKKGLKILEKNKLPPADLILSTYDDWGAHYLAYELKIKNKNAVWIADFRDPVGAHIKVGKYRNLCDEYSMFVSKNADYVTSVSKGCLDKLKLTCDVKKNVVTNGFDNEDYLYFKQVSKSICKSKKLKFVYTGSFYGNSLLPFFYAIRELIDERKIMEENIEIVYAGGYTDRVFSEIQKTSLDKVYIDKGILSRLEAVQLQEEADVLLTAVWNNKDYQGVIGGKILTYLMLKKPIIGIVIGDAPNSEIKEIIKNINCGWCYEEANHEQDFTMLKEVILRLYESKMSGDVPYIEYNEHELSKFNLKNITEKYINIFDSLQKE